MQRQRRPYWAGKAPDWAGADADEAPPHADAAEPTGAHASQGPTTDSRLLRLTQRQGSLTARRNAREAAVVRRRSPSPEAVAAARGQTAVRAPNRQPALVGADQGAGEEEADETDDAIAARRLAIRARQLATEAEVTAGTAVDEGSEDSSQYTTEDDSDSDHGHVLLKPAFVPRTERETLAEREAALLAAEQTTRQPTEQLEERRRQTEELVAQAQQQDAQQEASGVAAPELDTDDDANEVEEYEAWRERELHRIARDRHLRQEGIRAQSTATGGAAQSLLPLAPPKKKWKFLQKYWHRGAFFQGEGEEGESILGDVMHRDYNAPTGEDKFDKGMLPKIMQVRNFGRRGRTKWTHLLAEDTSAQAAEELPRLPSRHLQAQEFSKPKKLKT